MSRRRPVLDCSDSPSMTQQQFKASADINNILKQFDRTGLITHVAKGTPLYLDVSEMPDYRTALDHVRQVEDHFMTLPSEIRARFNNDPALYLDAMATSEDPLGTLTPPNEQPKQDPPVDSPNAPQAERPA